MKSGRKKTGRPKVDRLDVVVRLDREIIGWLEGIAQGAGVSRNQVITDLVELHRQFLSTANQWINEGKADSRTVVDMLGPNRVADALSRKVGAEFLRPAMADWEREQAMRLADFHREKRQRERDAQLERMKSLRKP